MKSTVYLNGRLVAEDKAVVSVFDRGFNYGDGIFETVMSEGGAPLFLKEHLQRLEHGRKSLGIGGIDSLKADIKAGVLERLLKANGIKGSQAALRITVTRGVDRHGHLPGRGIKPTVAIIVRRIDPARIKKMRRYGVKAVLVKGICPAFADIKTLNYLPNVVARLEAQKRDAAEAIFVDARSRLTEGSSTNLFVVSKGVVKTPPLKGRLCGVLPGVIRAAVIKAAQNNGIRVREAAVEEAELGGLDEAFLTNSVIGIAPLVKVGQVKIAGNRPGPVTRRLQRAMGLFPG